MSKPVYVNTEYRAARGPYGKNGCEMFCLTKWGVNRATGRWEHIRDAGMKSVAHFDEKEIHGVPVVYQ